MPALAPGIASHPDGGPTVTPPFPAISALSSVMAPHALLLHVTHASQGQTGAVGARVGLLRVGELDGDTVGDKLGPRLGAAEGAMLGAAVGVAEGVSVGLRLGGAVGSNVGALEGPAVGPAEGDAVGDTEGSAVGATLGTADGATVGATEGGALGFVVVGGNEGRAVGAALGATVGGMVQWHTNGHQSLTGTPNTTSSQNVAGSKAQRSLQPSASCVGPSEHKSGVGAADGAAVGAAVGDAVGSAVGFAVQKHDLGQYSETATPKSSSSQPYAGGPCVLQPGLSAIVLHTVDGAFEGGQVGDADGRQLGSRVGSAVGRSDGDCVGCPVGRLVGAEVTQVPHRTGQNCLTVAPTELLKRHAVSETIKQLSGSG